LLVAAWARKHAMLRASSAMLELPFRGQQLPPRIGVFRRRAAAVHWLAPLPRTTAALHDDLHALECGPEVLILENN